MEILDCSVIPIELTYDNFSYYEVLKKALSGTEGDQVDLPSSFETIGSIAHLNLREKYLKHKHLIAEVILDVCILFD